MAPPLFLFVVVPGDVGRGGGVTGGKRELLPSGVVPRRNVADLGRSRVARRVLNRSPEVTRTMAQRMSTAEARKDFAALLRSSASGERIKLTRYNKTVAVLIPKQDLDELEDCQRRHREIAKVRDGRGKRNGHQKPLRARRETARGDA